MNRRTALAAGLLPVLGLANRAFAEEPKTVPAAKMTLEKLKEILEALKLKHEEYRDSEKVLRGYTAAFQQDRNYYAFHALVTSDSSTVWLKAKLSKVADLEGVPAIVFLKLLAANWSVTPALFAYSDDDSELYLMMPTIAPGLTASGLRANLEFLMGVIKDKVKVWHPEFWPRTPEKKAEKAKN